MIHERVPKEHEANEREAPRAPARRTVHVQRSLTVGRSNDPAELEADRVAELLMHRLGASSPAEAAVDGDSAPTSVRRRTIAGRVADGIGAEGGPLDGPSSAELRRARGAGSPLDGGVRRSMERGLGVDLSAVRIHDGPVADRLGERMQANAFTTGNDIFFRHGQYQPGSRAGQRLLAHELTHVVQQGAAPVRRNVIRRDGVKKREDFLALEKLGKTVSFDHDATAFQQDGTTLLAPKTAADVESKLRGKTVAATAAVLQLTTALNGVGRYDLVITNPANKTKSFTITVHIVNTTAEAAEEAATATTLNEYLLLSAAATATTPQVDVYLEHHQNKHQHKNSMIAEIGTWKAKKGSLFASGKGLQWHRTNTAVMVRNWALSLGLVDGQSRTLKKAPLTDGYIYDASASRAGGVVNVSYHCNPTETE